MKKQTTLYAKIIDFKKRYFPGRIVPQKIASRIDIFFNRLHNYLITQKNKKKSKKDTTEIKKQNITIIETEPLIQGGKNQNEHSLNHLIKNDFNFQTRESNEKIALVAIAKNEGPYLMEWIAYHLMLGVDHIYIYDDGSTDNSQEAYETMYKTGKLTVLQALKTGQTSYKQTDCWELWRQQYGQLYDFVLPWDVDEFLALKAGMNLKQFLALIPHDVGEIRFNWKIFGSSGQLFADWSKFVIERFTKHSAANREHARITKTIIRLSAMTPGHVITHHVTGIKPEFKVVGGDLKTEVERSETKISPVIWNGFAVCHHYNIKSAEEFILIKKTRGYWPDCGRTITDEYFSPNDLNEIEDRSMIRHAEPLRKYIEEIKSIVWPRM